MCKSDLCWFWDYYEHLHILKVITIWRKQLIKMCLRPNYLGSVSSTIYFMLLLVSFLCSASSPRKQSECPNRSQFLQHLWLKFFFILIIYIPKILKEKRQKPYFSLNFFFLVHNTVQIYRFRYLCLSVYLSGWTLLDLIGNRTKHSSIWMRKSMWFPGRRGMFVSEGRWVEGKKASGVGCTSG